MTDDDFMKLQTLYASELPICPICSLEDTRHLLSDIVFEAPNTVSDGVRQLLQELLFIVTGALVSNRTEAEQDDQTEN
ncbi:MAG: hypothetical protein WA864_32095 [Acetobacteraceae bacterium]|jgi:hypothetical protein